MSLTAQTPTEAAAVATVSHVDFETSTGIEIHGTILRLMPQSVTFEFYTPVSALRLSEVLTKFRILVDAHAVYTGKAVVSSLINLGAATVCEVALASSLLEADLFQFASKEVLSGTFTDFLDRWQNYHRILPNYKLAVVDMQSLLQELRLWLEQIELGLRAVPPGDRVQREQTILRGLAEASRPALQQAFERFEHEAAAVPGDMAAAHRAFCHRQLHPLMMCCPFMHRIYTKPLGYAGDYEMINMIIRNEYEGGSLFAKLLQIFILDQPPAHAVRNRVAHFTHRFVEESCRVANTGRNVRIWSLGCGPAREVENFLMYHPLSDRAQFRLLDFNDETLSYCGNRIEDVRKRHNRRAPVELVKKSVHSLLKDAGKSGPDEPRFDVIYCSGLYDYLNDRVCKTLNTYLYDRLLPGGVLIVTNFAPNTPIRNIMEYFYEWFLIYRHVGELTPLAPAQATAGHCRVVAESSGCNMFLEVRKP